MKKNLNESQRHFDLKWAAVEWLCLNAKCKYIAIEIKIGKYIFDVIGSDGSKVFIIESKQSKADFLKDCNDPEIIQENIKNYKTEYKTTKDKSILKLLKKERKKSSKFFDKALLRLSTQRYVIAPDMLLKKDEIPENWGLINEMPKVVKKCSINKIQQRIADKVIKSISRKQTKTFLQYNGVKFVKRTVTFPNRISTF